LIIEKIVRKGVLKQVNRRRFSEMWLEASLSKFAIHVIMNDALKSILKYMYGIVNFSTIIKYKNVCYNLIFINIII